MSDPLPAVTIIIAARPDQTDIQAVPAARRIEYPPDRLDIIVARGRQPSIQRNAAARAARGDWIYFLDDDSMPQPENLRAASKYFADPAVKMIGGPNLCPPEAPSLERVFAVVLAGWIPFGPSRARYAPVGQPRATSEKELILCNLMMRRDALLDAGGFNEALYPNEENALMDELQKRGGKLIYDPALIVHRRPRRTLKAFIRMLMTYGRGRAEQFRVHPTPGSALNFVPPLFCLYLLGLIALASVPAPGDAFRIVRLGCAVPLAIFFAAILAQTLASMPVHGFVRSVLAAPLVAASPVIYGIGFWRGLFTRLQAPGTSASMPVNLETVSR